MNAYHVLAKTTEVSPDRSVSSMPKQEHFFVKAPTSAKAVALVEDHAFSLPVPPPPYGANIQRQFTVSEATDRGSSHMTQGEEIYSL